MDKVDLTDNEAVQRRIGEYFQIYAEEDVKPTMVGLAMALGIDRRRLWEIRTGQKSCGATPEVADSLKKAHSILENMWETYMQNGKVNPVAGIFLGKNNFGYKDQQDYVVTPSNDQASDYDRDAIMRRYLDDGNSVESEFAD